ncbi:hypothetical protein JZ751_026168 [Albula glossodonta]|uniref:BRCA1-associated ATM activator 1 n=1 Tax=Albula glossodonta TaxID=121402 RepID=A0A8T2PBA1_9TELE|nr:hypothetical protein JZ751_026168 [Albula glossodonta]
MDRRCAELLPLVCSVLADPKQAPSDDTCLEKLLDWFTDLTAPDSSLLEKNPCLITFITSVCASKTAEPSIISFALKLAGLLASTEEGFYVLKQQNVLESTFDQEGWSKSSLWEDATVRSGWVQGLRSMVQHQEAMLFLFKKGLIKVVLRLQTDKSLFVASAANQLLAHILNFGELTARCTSPENGGKTEPSVLHKDSRGWPECPEWDDGIVEVIKHVEESLVSGIPLHTCQSLKLVALSLTHCQPHVREMLWQSTVVATEVLLGNGLSSLTQQFMEVLQAAARTPLCNNSESGILTLMETMLCTLKPTQAIPFATGTVQLENCPQSLKKKALGVILLPLELVTVSTDLQELRSDPVEELGFLRSAVEEQLSQRTSCISVLCLSLSSTAELSSLHLEIPAQSLIPSVTTVLKVCLGMSFSSSPSTSVLRNLIGCSKVQKCALDALANLGQYSESAVFRREVFSILLHYLDSPDIDSTVLQKAFQVTLKWLCTCSELPPQDLFPVLKKRLCDIRWEIRDSSLEFLTQLTSDFQENRSYCQTFSSSGVPDLLLTLLTDPESYVRASAILALGRTVGIIGKEGVPKSGPVLQEDLARQFVDILAQDTEVFARRAVMRVFTLWLTTSHPASEELLSSVLALGSEDLDWEVKVHTLELAEILINQTLARTGHSTCPYAVIPATHSSGANLTESLHRLQHLKIFAVLLKGLFDCDRPVALRACSLLLSLKEVITESEVCDLHGQSWVEGVLKEHLKKLDVGGDSRESVGLAEVLSVLDLENMQKNLGQRSDHLENSPRSLMEDILAATCISPEDNVVDCY